MSEYILGWGGPGWNNSPQELPFSPDNYGSLVDYGSTWYYGVAPDGYTPEDVDIQLHFTFFPADGSEIRTAVSYYSTENASPVDFFRGEYSQHPGAGVFEVQVFADGVRGPNKLVLVVTMPEGGYGEISYYAESNSGQLQAFWTGFQAAREIP